MKPENTELERLKLNKQGGFAYRERREEHWRENYTFYRDEVTVNRLTQRQSVNIPLMKQVIKTLLKDVDDMPVLYFENLDNDKQAELFQNEYWKWTLDLNKAELKDIVDKRQVFLFGRSFDQMQVIDGSIRWEIIDPEDMLVDRYMDPTDIDSARFLVHTHIFKPLSELEKNPNYDEKAIARLKQYYATSEGVKKSATNQETLRQKNQKMADLGVDDVNDPILGESYVELSMHFVYSKDKEDEDEQIYVYVECDDMEILMKKTLEEVIGSTEDHFWQKHYPYNSWADDVDKQDFWSDGIADIVRTPNKVLNSWFSQMVENRTLRNYGMNYYDSTIENFSPPTFEPKPFGWYPLPGKPADVFQKVDIPDLSESLDEMEFLIALVEKATGATPTQQGVQTDRQVTLGEVQLALGEAKERVKGMSKFYTPAWKARGEKFLKLIEAASDKLVAVKIYKKGKNSADLYSREISPSDWMTKSGYTTRVWTQDEKAGFDADALQKLNAVKAFMPDNPKLNEIYQRKLLEFAGVTPEQQNDIMEFERKKLEMGITPLLPGQVSPQPQLTTQPAQRPVGAYA